MNKVHGPYGLYGPVHLWATIPDRTIHTISFSIKFVPNRILPVCWSRCSRPHHEPALEYKLWGWCGVQIHLSLRGSSNSLYEHSAYSRRAHTRGGLDIVKIVLQGLLPYMLNLRPTPASKFIFASGSGWSQVRTAGYPFGANSMENNIMCTVWSQYVPNF